MIAPRRNASPLLPIDWNELAAQAKLVNLVVSGSSLKRAEREQLEGLWNHCHALLDHAQVGDQLVIVTDEDAVPPTNITTERVLLRALAVTAPVRRSEGRAVIAGCCYCHATVRGAAWIEDHFGYCPWILARRHFDLPVGSVLVARAAQRNAL